MADVSNALYTLDKADKALDLETPLYLLTRGTIRVLRAHAPVDTGNLKAGIGVISQQRGKTAVVGVSLKATARRPTQVRGPARPFDYVAITRFGHRVARIYPKQLREPASVVATHRKRKAGRRGALAVGFGNGLFFFASVKGYKPKSDWVADAGPEIQTELQRVTLNLKRKLSS